MTDVDPAKIKLADDGFCSRGYVINAGEIVFKFKKTPEVTYESEIRMLNFVNSLGLEIKLQKVGWISPTDEYLGVYGVVGKSLGTTDYDVNNVGRQLGSFLTKLHNSNLDNADVLDLDDEIKAWQERFDSTSSREAMSGFFSKNEMDHLDDYMHHKMPTELQALGKKLVLSHGDLGDGNVFVDKNGKVGVIDFNETCYLDEAADFMDLSSDALCEEMLNSYGADEILRRKTAIRRQLRPLIVFGSYAGRGDKEKVGELVEEIRRRVLEDF